MHFCTDYDAISFRASDIYGVVLADWIQPLDKTVYVFFYDKAGGFSNREFGYQSRKFNETLFGLLF